MALPPWGSITENEPDPAGNNQCNGSATPKSYTWEINGQTFDDDKANWNPNPNGQPSDRSSWNTTAGDLKVHYKVDVQIKGAADLSKWFTCKLTCKAEGVYTVITSAKRVSDKLTFHWQQVTTPPTKVFDANAKVQPYKLGKDEEISDEEWTTYHRFPCVTKEYDVYETMRRAEVSRIWDPTTKKFKKTTHGTVYSCNLVCPSGSKGTVKSRAYDPSLPHADKPTTTG